MNNRRMPGSSESSAASTGVPGPAHLRRYPGHRLVAWRPEGVLDDQLVDAIGEWLFRVEKDSALFNRLVDFSRLTEVAVRTSHLFQFAEQRAGQFPGPTAVRSALLAEDWIHFGIACMYEGLMKRTLIEARAFRDREQAAAWLGVPAEVLSLKDTPAPSS